MWTEITSELVSQLPLLSHHIPLSIEQPDWSFQNASHTMPPSLLNGFPSYLEKIQVMYPGFGLPPSLTSSCVTLLLPYYSTATLMTILFLNYVKLVPVVESSRWLFPLPLSDPHSWFLVIQISASLNVSPKKPSLIQSNAAHHINLYHNLHSTQKYC